MARFVTPRGVEVEVSNPAAALAVGYRPVPTTSSEEPKPAKKKATARKRAAKKSE